MNTIHVLTGCTAGGKTAAALAWAERNQAEILSCDALLFYRGMDVGTAKPTPAERARVPHHLVDIRDVTEPMDVRTYLAQARAAVRDILGRGRTVLVVGGSGFYLRSFFAPVADEVAVDPQLRQRLERDLEEQGLAELVRRLRELNPEGLGGLDARNPRRVLRALERCLASGRPLAELLTRFRGQPPPFAGCTIRLTEIVRAPEELRGRIAARVQQMLAAGLIDEVRRLQARGLERNPSAARAIGYRETLAWLREGGRDESALAAAIATNTWKLVRKQRTWFRTQLPEHRRVELGPESREDELPLFGG